MSSQTIDEDGFHSIAWDDAPPRTVTSGFQNISTSSINGENDSDNGFESISPPTSATFKGSEETMRHSSDGNGENIASSSRTVMGTSRGGGDGTEDWTGQWMSIEVKDPVKEHEGSKDMFVSYAVRTKVSLSGTYKPLLRL